MKIEHFEILARDRFDHCLKLMVGQKHKEYSRQDDKLHNFKRAGMVLGTTPEKALIGMLAKHLISVLDIVDDLDDLKYPTPETLNEKITDSINYLVLLEALFLEKIADPSTQEINPT